MGEQAPPIDMRPMVFWQSFGRRLEDIVRETSAESENCGSDAALLQCQLAETKAALQNHTRKFESADKKRLAELEKKRVHELCILRVICPDKSVLQVHFRAADKGEHVLAQLGPLFSKPVQASGWYIYQSPPMKRLAPRETLVAAGLAPGANMYLGFDGSRPEPPFLDSELVAKLGPNPENGGHGVNTSAGPVFS